jgi:hypothetical protein
MVPAPCCLHVLTALLALAGVMFGDRVVKYHDTITFSDAQHGLK